MYYEKLAATCRAFRTVTALLLAAVMVLSVFLTYGFLVDNQFRYLYKIWKINPVSLNRQYNDITYAAGNGAKFVFYKDDLGVIENGKFSVFDLSGDRRFRTEAPNSAQAFASSEKYVALYTPGDKRLAIYDSFSVVYDHAFPYPIRLAAVSDSGMFAVCLREEERIVIEVYNQDSKKQFSVSVPKDTVVYDLDLSENGDKIAITTMEGGNTAEAGNYYTKFALWDISSGKNIFSEQIAGKKPVETSFFDNTRMFFAAQGTVIFCQTNGKKLQTVTAPVQSMVATDGKTVAVSDGTSLVTVYSSKGEQKTAFSLSEKIIGLKVKDGCCYVFTGRSITVYDGDGNRKGTCEIPSGALDFFIPDDGSILICYVSETKRMVP